MGHMTTSGQNQVFIVSACADSIGAWNEVYQGPIDGGFFEWSKNCLEYPNQISAC